MVAAATIFSQETRLVITLVIIKEVITHSLVTKMFIHM